MKKVLLVTLGMSSLLAATSCKKDILDENPQSVLVPSFLSTPQGVEAGLTGVYSGFRNIYGNEQSMFMTVTGTDEFMRGISSQSGLDEYTPGTLTPTQATAITNQWGIMYQYINAANGVIQYAATSQGITPARVQQVIAEAKLLRAQYYFLLVQHFGDVPLMLSFVDAPTKDITRAPVADVYKSIIADLTDAMNNIGPTSVGSTGTAQVGHVTKATALHLLAKVYLTRATTATAQQNDDYANAAKYAKQLIDMQSTYGVGLETDPAAVYAQGNENGKEVLFNVQFNYDATFSQTDGNNYNASNVTNFLYRSRYDQLPNMVRDQPNGRPFARFCTTDYLLNSYILPTETGRAIRSTDTRYNKWFTQVWYVNSPGDHGGSKTAIVGDTAAWYPGRELTAAELTRIAARPKGGFYVVTPSHYTTEYYPVMNKWDDSKRTGINNPSGRPVIIYRLAETYLIAAEAYMYLGNTAQAATYINVVRERAAASGKAAAMDITAGQVNIDFILDERTRELGGEQMRWFDLKRTGKLIERVKKYVPAQVSRTNPSGTYGSAAAANIQPFHLLRPIPQQEIDRTSGKIIQNPGY